MYIKFFKSTIIAVVFICLLAVGQGTVALASQSDAADKKIVVNLASRYLALYQNGTRIKLYRICPGSISSPTPTGYYEIVEMEKNPTWIDPQDLQHVVPSGPDNPLGYRWIGFSGVYGIHGTNSPETIGYFASHGCIRLEESNVEELYELVDIGTPIEIFYNRVVVEKLPDNTVEYYIYDDGYNMQKVEPKDVLGWLSGYGVADWASEKDIAKKIEISDGKPTAVAKVFPVSLNGVPVKLKAIKKEHNIYFNVVQLSELLNMRPEFSKDKQQVVTPNGYTDVVWLNGNAYVAAVALPILYKLNGKLTVDGKYTLTALHK